MQAYLLREGYPPCSSLSLGIGICRAVMGNFCLFVRRSLLLGSRTLHSREVFPIISWPAHLVRDSRLNEWRRKASQMLGSWTKPGALAS